MNVTFKYLCLYMPVVLKCAVTNRKTLFYHLIYQKQSLMLVIPTKLPFIFHNNGFKVDLINLAIYHINLAQNMLLASSFTCKYFEYVIYL